jgi:mono/diheme cytochrome c family protein
MKTAIVLTALGMLLAGLPATAQAPHENHWDISKVDVTKLPPASDQKDVTYDKDILPLFKASCVRCHGSEKPRGGLTLDTLDAVLKGGKQGKMVIPGDSKNSLLVVAAARIDDNTAMPPKRRPRPGPPPGGTNAPAGGPGGPGKGGPPPKPLTAEEVGLVRAWIDQGAK